MRRLDRCVTFHIDASALGQQSGHSAERLSLQSEPIRRIHEHHIEA
jgi:hypothetical protein